MAGPPNPIPNLQAPNGVVGLDNITGAAGASNLANYTVNTVGTNTITTGRSSNGGVFLGVSVPSGAPVVSAFDVVGTNTIAILPLTTATLGQTLSPGPAGVGVRFLGTLVVVTTGTANSLTLWD